MQPTAFVILPDGRLDPNAAHLIPDDVALEPIVFPVVSEGRAAQQNYEHARLKGETHEWAFAFAAKHEAKRRLRSIPYEDGETLHFGHGIRNGGPCLDSVAGIKGFEQQVSYWLMRFKGQSHNIAEMLATRSFPGLKTDAVFNEGKFSGTSTAECGPRGDWLRRQAEAAGVSTTGKWYCSGLARFPGDPKAWVGDRGDVLRVARENNMTVHGYVEHKGHEADPGEDLAIADEIIEDEVADILGSNPFADRESVREQVYQLRTGAVDPNPLVLQE